jgi:hypothetical protein
MERRSAPATSMRPTTPRASALPRPAAYISRPSWARRVVRVSCWRAAHSGSSFTHSTTPRCQQAAAATIPPEKELVSQPLHVSRLTIPVGCACTELDLELDIRNSGLQFTYLVERGIMVWKLEPRVPLVTNSGEGAPIYRAGRRQAWCRTHAVRQAAYWDAAQQDQV